MVSRTNGRIARVALIVGAPTFFLMAVERKKGNVISCFIVYTRARSAMEGEARFRNERIHIYVCMLHYSFLRWNFFYLSL